MEKSHHHHGEKKHAETAHKTPDKEEHHVRHAKHKRRVMGYDLSKVVLWFSLMLLLALIALLILKNPNQGLGGMKTGDTLDACGRIGDKNLENKCYYDAAVSFNDIGICDKIDDKHIIKLRCYLYFLDSKDPALRNSADRILVGKYQYCKKKDDCYAPALCSQNRCINKDYAGLVGWNIACKNDTCYSGNCNCDCVGGTCTLIKPRI